MLLRWWHGEEVAVTGRDDRRGKRHRQVHTQMRRCKLRDLRPRRTLRCILCVAGAHGSAGNLTRILVSQFKSFTKILSTSRRSLLAIRKMNPSATQVLRLLPRINECCARYTIGKGGYVGAASRLIRCLVTRFTKAIRRHTLLATLSNHDHVGKLF